MPIVPSPLIPSHPSPQLQAVLTWLDAASKADFGAIAGLVTQDYTQSLFPASLHTHEVTKGEVLAETFQEILPKFTVNMITVHEIIETSDQIVTHLSSDAHASFGYHYQNEYIFTFDLAQQADGSFKIKKAKEFADTKATVALLEAWKTLKASPSSESTGTA